MPPRHFAKKAEGMFMRWKMTALVRDALRDGSAHEESGLRHLFATRGYEVGAYCVNPCAERIVLEEALEGRTTEELVVLFFRELGGRYSMGRDMDVWTELIRADASRVMRSAQTMEGLVRVLVDTLKLPLPQDEDMLLHMAHTEGGWNALLALGPRLMAEQFELESVWVPRLCTLPDGGLEDVWLAQVLLPRLSDSTVVRCHAQGLKRALMGAEVEHRRETVRQKQIMLLLRKSDDAPEWLVRVFHDPLLAYHLVREVAFLDVERSLWP
jgi:hypothetical protein